MLCNWSVESLLFPLFYMWGIISFMEWSIGNKSVLVGISNLLVVEVIPLEA
jgi:hypothetical protein